MKGGSWVVKEENRKEPAPDTLCVYWIHRWLCWNDFSKIRSSEGLHIYAQLRFGIRKDKEENAVVATDLETEPRKKYFFIFFFFVKWLSPGWAITISNLDLDALLRLHQIKSRLWNYTFIGGVHMVWRWMFLNINAKCKIWSWIFQFWPY